MIVFFCANDYKLNKQTGQASQALKHHSATWCYKSIKAFSALSFTSISTFCK